jgi:hypothetical protein
LRKFSKFHRKCSLDIQQYISGRDTEDEQAGLLDEVSNGNEVWFTQHKQSIYRAGAIECHITSIWKGYISSWLTRSYITEFAESHTMKITP